MTMSLRREGGYSISGLMVGVGASWVITLGLLCGSTTTATEAGGLPKTFIGHSEASDQVGGITLYGHDFGQAQAGAEVQAAFGEKKRVEVYLQITEPLASETHLVAKMPGVVAETHLGSLTGERQGRIGEVLSWPISFDLNLLPTSEQSLPFFDDKSYAIKIEAKRAVDSVVLLEDDVFRLNIQSMLPKDPRIVCLTSNSDIPTSKRSGKRVSFGFPGGDPTHHASGTGDVMSELTDGVFSHSGNPNWESVYWRLGWGTGERSIEAHLASLSTVVGVCVIVANTYPNYRTDRMVVSAFDKDVYVPIGEDALVDTGRRPSIGALFSAFVPTKTTRLKIDLVQTGGEFLSVSEVFVFGY